MSVLNQLQNHFYSTTTTETKQAHKGNANLFFNHKVGEYIHPVAKVVRRTLHKIR